MCIRDRAEDVPLPDELLPGTRETQTSLKEGLQKVGVSTFTILLIIVSLDNLQSSGLAVLAPNIQASLHVSSGVIVFVSGISGGFLVLGIVPLGWLADRVRRAPIVGIATLVFGIMVFATGVASNIFLFFLARFGAGVSQSSTQTVHTSLLADTYPIGLRGRISAGMAIGAGTATALSPVSYTHLDVYKRQQMTLHPDTKMKMTGYAVVAVAGRLPKPPMPRVMLSLIHI